MTVSVESADFARQVRLCKAAALFCSPSVELEEMLRHNKFLIVPPFLGLNGTLCYPPCQWVRFMCALEL